MAIKTRTERTLVSDIDGQTLREDQHVRMTIRAGNGGTWVLDASFDDELIQDIISYARDTSRMGRRNGSSN